MPEVFTHDSSEEKLWAKYSDILLAKAFENLGLQSEVIRMRGDSADVHAKSPSYRIVGDAKTFRLSRTAKNQKDFKVESLNSWRRSFEYAMLAGPMNQFPNSSSAIYRQAVLSNVTLLSYAHLHFLIRFFKPGIGLEKLWNIGKTIENNTGSTKLKSATYYWKAINETVVDLCGATSADLEKIKKLDQKIVRGLGDEGIRYWEGKIEEYRKLTKEEAIRRLLKADKIEAKIDQIKKTISRGDLE